MIDRIYDLEQERDRKARQTKEERRFARVTALMDRVPDVPTDLRDWIDKQFTGGKNWCIKDRDTKKWVCSACGGSFELKNKPRNNDNITCPECNREIKYLSRKRKVEMVEHFCLIQPMDTDTSVCRHFVTEITFEPGVCEHKNIWIDEEIRVILNKQIDTLEFNRKKKQNATSTISSGVTLITKEIRRTSGNMLEHCMMPASWKPSRIQAMSRGAGYSPRWRQRDSSATGMQ